MERPISIKILVKAYHTILTHTLNTRISPFPFYSVCLLNKQGLPLYAIVGTGSD